MCFLSCQSPLRQDFTKIWNRATRHRFYTQLPYHLSRDKIKIAKKKFVTLSLISLSSKTCEAQSTPTCNDNPCGYLSASVVWGRGLNPDPESHPETIARGDWTLEARVEK